MTNIEIEHAVQTLLADDDSDCAFALRWAELTQQQRENLLFSTVQNDLAPCRQMLINIFWSDAVRETPRDRMLWVDLTRAASNPPDDKIAGIVADESRLCEESERYGLSPRQHRLTFLVFKHFVLHRNQEITSKYLVSEMGEDACFWEIDLSAPTAHQRLEAHLNLRDWLLDKVSGVQMAGLMPQ